MSFSNFFDKLLKIDYEIWKTIKNIEKLIFVIINSLILIKLKKKKKK